MEAWAREGAGPGGRALLVGGGCTGPAAWGKPTGCCYGTSGSRATPEVKGNQGKSGGKGGDNNKEGAATGAARGQFRARGRPREAGLRRKWRQQSRASRGVWAKGQFRSWGWSGAWAKRLPGPGAEGVPVRSWPGSRWHLGLTLLLLFHGAVAIRRHDANRRWNCLSKLSYPSALSACDPLPFSSKLGAPGASCLSSPLYVLFSRGHPPLILRGCLWSIPPASS